MWTLPLPPSRTSGRRISRKGAKKKRGLKNAREIGARSRHGTCGARSSPELALTVDQVRLATSGIGAATLTVRGRASHAGAAPERGVNALYELAHQVLQARDLSDPAVGLQVNWTLARAGIVRNMIPPGAQAQVGMNCPPRCGALPAPLMQRDAAKPGTPFDGNDGRWSTPA